MRIGINHGSLSDRIMSRYGDTPMGMVESAMEFLRIARNESYHNIILEHEIQQSAGNGTGIPVAGERNDGRIWRMLSLAPGCNRSR